MKLIISALLSKLLLSTSAWAAAGEYDTSGSSEPPAWKKAVADQDWAVAITLLEAQVTANNGTANVHNMLGYSYRKAGNFDKAFEHYAVALRMNPEHRGAHEYVGRPIWRWAIWKWEKNTSTLWTESAFSAARNTTI